MVSQCIELTQSNQGPGIFLPFRLRPVDASSLHQALCKIWLYTRPSGKARGGKLGWGLSSKKDEWLNEVPCSNQSLKVMSDALAKYLYDHLCGATIAVEVLTALRESSKGTPLGNFIASVLNEAVSERECLIRVSGKLGRNADSFRQQEWLIKKSALIKRQLFSTSHSGATHAMQYLVMILGPKVFLWKLLGIVAKTDQRLDDYDFNQLASRAQMQHDAIKQQWIELRKPCPPDEEMPSHTARRLYSWDQESKPARCSFTFPFKRKHSLGKTLKLKGFAVLVLVGPSPADLQGLQDLIESLLCYEAKMHWLVIIDDSQIDRGLASGVVTPSYCTTISIHNPREGRGNPRLGGQCSGVLAGLSWLFEHATPAFVLKLDTDTLIIAPFVTKLAESADEKTNVGIIGVLGPTADRSSAIFRCQFFWPSPIIVEYVTRYGHLPRLTNEANGKNASRQYRGTADSLWTPKIKSDIERAYSNGYLGLHYCQGGSYAISATMLKRLGEDGLLRDGNDWTSFPVGEDVMMGMYASAVGLNVCDCSATGEVFGVQFRALPHSPEELLHRKYSIIHSVRNNSNLSEDHIRNFFRSRRNA